MIKKPKTRKRTVALEYIRISKLNRDRTRTEEGISRLAESIEKIGQLHPIIVRPLGTAGRVFELIAGRRRYEALKHLGMKEADVLEIRCDDATAEFISIHENLQVEALSKAEWGQDIKRAHELLTESIQKEIDKNWEDYPIKPRAKPPKTQEELEKEFIGTVPNNSRGRPKSASRQATLELADRYKVSESKVHRAVKHEENLISVAKKSLRRGKISISQADRLTAVPRKEQAGELAKMLQETREQTKRRERGDLRNTDITSFAILELKDIVKSSKALWKKIDDLCSYLYDNRTEVNWDELKRVNLESLSECGRLLVGEDGIGVYINSNK